MKSAGWVAIKGADRMSNEPNGLFEFGSYRLHAAKRLLTRYGESLVRAQQMTFAFGSSGAAVACWQRPT